MRRKLTWNSAVNFDSLMLKWLLLLSIFSFSSTFFLSPLLLHSIELPFAFASRVHWLHRIVFIYKIILGTYCTFPYLTVIMTHLTFAERDLIRRISAFPSLPFEGENHEYDAKLHNRAINFIILVFHALLKTAPVIITKRRFFFHSFWLEKFVFG